MKVTVIFEEGRATGPNPEHFHDVIEEPRYHNPSNRYLISRQVGGKQVDRWIRSEDVKDLEVWY
jgi:hypothetical protein